MAWTIVATLAKGSLIAWADDDLSGGTGVTVAARQALQRPSETYCCRYRQRDRN